MVLLANFSLQMLLNSSHGQVYCPKRWSAKFNVQVIILALIGPQLAGGGTSTEHRAHGWLGLAWILQVEKGQDIGSLYI